MDNIIKKGLLSMPWPSFVANQSAQLDIRLAEKTKILSAGGQAALSHSEADLKRINYAKLRISAGTYGQCCKCGTPVNKERLLLIPETPFCGACAKEREINKLKKAN